MRKQTIRIMGAIFLTIVFLTAPAYAQLGAPTCVSPKVQFGESGPYYAPRVPTFSWTPVPGATWYQVWISEAATPLIAVILQWIKNGTSWTPNRDRALSPGTAYSWWVRAWNKTDHYGPWSRRADFTAGRPKAMAINANAFVPYVDGYDYVRYNGGGALRPNDSSSNEWCAPVNLPQGAKVNYVTFYYYNFGAVTTPSQCWLYRSFFNSMNREEMGYVTAGTSIGYSNRADTYIDHDIINNNLYSYFLRVDLPSASNYLLHVEVGYWD